MKTCKVLSLLAAGAFFFLLSCDDTHVFDNPNDSRADHYSPPATYVIPSASDTHLAKRDTLRVAVKDSASVFAFGRDSVAHDSIAAFRFQWKRNDSVAHDTIVATKGHAIGSVSIPVTSMGNFSVMATAKDTVGTWDTSSALSYVKVFRCRGICLDTSLMTKRNGDTLSDTSLSLYWYHPMFDSVTDIKVDNVVRHSVTDTMVTLKGTDGITWGRSGIVKHNISFKAYAKGGKGVDTSLSLNFNVLPDPAFDSIPAKLWIVKNGIDTVFLTKDATDLTVSSRNFLIGAKLKYANGVGMQSLQVLNGTAQSNGCYNYTMAGTSDSIYVDVLSANDSAVSKYKVAVTLNGTVQKYVKLDSLKLSDTTKASLTPRFDQGTGAYNLTIARGDSVRLKWYNQYPTTQVNGSSNDTGSVLVSNGKTTAAFVLSSSLGDTNVYRVNVVWGKAHDPRLVNLGTLPGILAPSFSPDSTNYTLNIPSNLDSLNFNPTALSGARNISYSSRNLISTSGMLAFPQRLAISDTINITNTSERGDSSKTYSIVVKRFAVGTDARLKGLSVDSGYVDAQYLRDSTINPDSVIVVRSWANKLNIKPILSDTSARAYFNNAPYLVYPQSIGVDSSALITFSVVAQMDTARFKVLVLRTNDARIVFDTLWAERGIVSPTYNYMSEKYAYNVIVNRGDTTKLHFRLNDTLNSIAWSPASNGAAYRSVYPVHGGNDTSVSMVVTSKKTAVYNVYTFGIFSGDETRLKSLSITGQRSTILTPAFNPDSTKYALTVNAFDTAVNIAGTTRCSLAKAYLGANSTDSVTAQGIVHKLPAHGLEVFDTVNINVLGANGQTKGTYAVVIHRPLPSTNTVLDTLTSDSNFVAKVGPNSYVVKAVSKILRFKAIPKDTFATVKFVDTTNARAILTSISIDTNSKTKVYAVVTAQNGTDSATDTITVLRGNDARVMLDSIWVDHGAISPEFNYLSGNYKYSLFVKRNDLAANLRFKINDTTKTTGWSPVNNGKAYESTYPLSMPNDTSVNMVVLGASSSLNLYAFNIYLRDEARLNALSITGQSTGTLAPVFNLDSLKYAMTVGASDSLVTLVAKPKATYGKASINGDTAVMHSLTVPLNAGNDTLNVTSKAMDTSVIQNYRLIITRPAALSNLGISVRNPVSGTYTTVGTSNFNGDSLNYVLSGTVPFATDSIRFFPVSYDTQNIITIAGKVLKSKDSLAVGIPAKGDSIKNTVTVQSKDGKSTLKYSILILKAASEKDSLLGGLTITGSYSGNMAVAFDSNATSYRGNQAVLARFQDTAVTIIPATKSALAKIIPDSIAFKHVGSSAFVGRVHATGLSGISLLKVGDSTLKVGDSVMVTFTVVAEDTSIRRRDSVVIVRGADAVPPVVVRSSQTKDTILDFGTSSITEAWTVTDNDSLQSVTIGGVSVVGVAGAYSATIPLSGNQHVVLVATDRAGNVTRDSVNVSIMSDTVKPKDTAIAGTVSRTVPFDTFTVTAGWKVGDNDAVKSVTISGVTLPAPATGDVYTHSINLSVGTNVIQLIATDRSGNSDTEAVTITRLADTTRPRVSIDTLASQGGWTIGATSQSRSVAFDTTKAVLSWGVTDNDKVASVTVGSGIMGKTLAAQAGHYLDTVYSLSLGENDFLLTAMDPAGNVTYDTVKVIRAADAVKPVVIRTVLDTVTSVPYSRDTMSASWKVTDNDQLSSVTIAGAAVAGDTAHVYSAVVHMLAGKDTIRLVATDRTGNVTYDSIVVTRIDTTAPQALRGAGVTARAVVFDTTSATLSWTVTDNDHVASVTIGGVAATQSSNLWTAKVPLAVGSDTIRMVGKDRAGNAVNDSIVIVRARDATPPVAVRSSTTKDTTIPYAATGYAVSWAVKDNDSTAPKVTINGSSVTPSGSSYATTISAPLPKDSAWVILSAKDTTGNETRDSVKVHRMGPSSVATLSSLGASTGTLSPAVNSVDSVYTLTVNYTTASVTIAPTVLDPTAKATAKATTITLGAAGTTTSDTIVVTAQDSSKKTYVVNVVRSAMPNVLPASISRDTTLKASGSPYLVSSTYGLQVTNGATLTIEAGTRIQLDAGKTFEIRKGSIIARGTPASPIVFTKNGSGNWGYLQISDSIAKFSMLTNAYSSGPILENVVIEYGGATSLTSDSAALRITQSSPYLHNVTVRSSASNGILTFNNAGYYIHADSLLLTDNQWDGWHGNGVTDSSVFTGCKALRNGRDGFAGMGNGNTFTGDVATENERNGFSNFGTSTFTGCLAQSNGVNGYDYIAGVINSSRALSNINWGVFNGNGLTINNTVASGNRKGIGFGNFSLYYSRIDNSIDTALYTSNGCCGAYYFVGDSVMSNVSSGIITYVNLYSGDFKGNYFLNNTSTSTSTTPTIQVWDYHGSGVTSNFIEGNSLGAYGIILYGYAGGDSGNVIRGNKATNYVFNNNYSHGDLIVGNTSMNGPIVDLDGTSESMTRCTLDSNSVTSAGGAIVGVYGSGNSLTYNNFGDHQTYDSTHYLVRNYSSNSVNAEHNYWLGNGQGGVYDQAIPSMLYDNSDDVTVGKIDASNPSYDAITTAPALP